MTKIVDPDQLNRGTEYQYDTTTPAARTFQLLVAGNLDDLSPGATSGVTGQCAYSRMILDFSAATGAGVDLRKHTFPIAMRTESEGTWATNWGPEDAQTRELYRDFGWTETNGDEYAGFAQLDSMDSDTDPSTYQWVAGGGGAVANFDKTGRINEALLVQAGGTYLQLRQRVEGKQHAEYEVVSRLDLASLQGRLYSILLGNATDPNIVETDANIDANAPYTAMSLDYLTGGHPTVTTWAATTAYATGDIVYVGAGAYAGRYLRATVGGTSGATDPTGAGADGSVTWEVDPGERLIGANYFHFSRPIDGATGTVQQIQNWGQRQLRKSTDINADTNGDAFGAVNGTNAEELFNVPSAFEGEVLLYAEGVFVDNIAGTDLNKQRYIPHQVDGANAPGTAANGSVENPFKTNLKIIVPPEFVGGIVTVFFQNDDAGDDTARDFDTDDAIVVQDDLLADMDFVTVGTETNLTFDFDNNIQRGAASAGIAAPVIAHGIRAGFTVPATAVATITRVDNVDIRLTVNADTVFSNP